MKKFLLLLCLFFIGAVSLSARTYRVTLEVYTEYKYIDVKTGQELGLEKDSGQCHTYTVEAPTEDEARMSAYEKCARACRSDWTVESSNAQYNGKACKKLVRQVANRSTITVVQE